MLLRYRDGARMVAGTRVRSPEVFGVMEATLRMFADQCVNADQAALCFTKQEQIVYAPTFGSMPAARS